MAEASENEVTELTFEEGYEELKGIVKRLDAEDASVHDTCELFARGKGLEKELRSYLTTQQGKLERIEAGEDLPKFRIVAPSGGADDQGEQPAAQDDDWFDEEPEAAKDVPADSSDFAAAPAGGGAQDDDIPF